MIIGLIGKAGVGKDTIADYLCANYGYTKLAFADSLRDMVYTLNPVVESTTRLQHIVDRHGWDTAKRACPEVRRLLQVFGTEVIRQQFGENAWVELMDKKLEQLYFEQVGLKDGVVVVEDLNVVITDIRFPNEDALITKLKGKRVLVTREEAVPILSHVSETYQPEKCEYAIHNNATLAALTMMVDEMMEQLRRKA